jgi:hypothetical protein
MIHTCYLWRWAENDRPGRPAEVLAALAAGQTAAALQPFRICQVHARLVRLLEAHRGAWREVHIERAAAVDSGAWWIRLTGCVPRLAPQLLGAVWEAGLTVYDATSDRLVGLPKHNLVEMAGRRQFVDVEVADLPGLLHELAGTPGLAALACYDRDGNMFQVWAHGRQFAVEWQVLVNRQPQHHRIWVAGRPGTSRRRWRLGTVATGLDLFAPERLSVAEVYRLWRSFLTNPCRPPSHRWRDVTAQLNQPGQPPRIGALGAPPAGVN